MNSRKYFFCFLTLSLFAPSFCDAATIVDFNNKSFNNKKTTKIESINSYDLRNIAEHTDFNHVTHTRMQQFYNNIPVWNAIVIKHQPSQDKTNALYTGRLYQHLMFDLTKQNVNNVIQKEQALRIAKDEFQKKLNISVMNSIQEKVTTIIYIDDQSQAHYAKLVSFYIDDHLTGAHHYFSIIDATTGQVFHSWDSVRTAKTEHNQNIENVMAGGVGGNRKTGPIVYDNLPGNYPSVLMKRSTEYPDYCYLRNDTFELFDTSYQSRQINTLCSPNAKHNNLLWISMDDNGTRWIFDEANGGNAPSLDVLFALNTTEKMYKDWYGLSMPADKNNSLARIPVYTHYGRNYDNASWTGFSILIGDGDENHYPFTSLDIIAHEMTHALAQNHMGLQANYENELSSLEESFADMGGAATVYYLTNKPLAEFGRSIVKGAGALRYFDDPKKDGHSIDNYHDIEKCQGDAYCMAGIFNKAFYNLATSPGWNPQKAFNVMVKANLDYWGAGNMQNLVDAACGVMAATNDYSYPAPDVANVFNEVGINTQVCKK